jgi:hypothetical protein
MLNDFKTAYGDKISHFDLILSINNFILEKPEYQYKIFVGTDSENRENKIEFISVIVVHRVGYGAKYFWRKKTILKKLDFYQRLWQEAIFSLNLSQDLIENLSNLGLNFDFEVHLDLGLNGKSKSLIKEIINLIKNSGFEVKIKPESFAASKIADYLL